MVSQRSPLHETGTKINEKELKPENDKYEKYPTKIRKSVKGV